MNDLKIVVELTRDDIGMLRGAIDLVVKQGGMIAARQLLSIDDKLIRAFEVSGNKV